MDLRPGGPRWAVLFFAVAIGGLVGHQVVAGYGISEAQGGFAYGQNDERTVIGLKLQVAPGAVLHIAMSDVDPYRCGVAASGERMCAGRGPGVPGHHDGDAGATFFVTAAGDAHRVLNGEEPRHVLVREAAPEPWRKEFQVLRPAVPEDVRPDAEAPHTAQWQATEPEVHVVEVFWVLENATAPGFDDAAHGGPASPAFHLRPHQVWVTAAWYDEVDAALTASTIIAGLLGGAATVMWIAELARGRRAAVPDGVEHWLEVMASEMQRIDALMFRIALVGGIMVAAVAGAALFGFWAMAPPEPGEPHSLYDAAPSLGEARAADVLRWSLVAAALAAGALWAASVAQIHIRRRRMTAHMARPPEL